MSTSSGVSEGMEKHGRSLRPGVDIKRPGVSITLPLLIFLLHPDRFAKRYEYIADSQIIHYLVYYEPEDKNSCPIWPNNSMVVQDPPTEVYYDDSKVAKDLGVNKGGWWTPKECVAVHEVAIIIPYRDRPGQLKLFFSYIHKFLQSQLISYRIIVVEQAPGKQFNRGKLMNVGYKEALKIQPFLCFILHDVDLIPQVASNIYGCTYYPRHMSASINVWRYNLLYDGAFGGAVTILTEQFKQINGFSNIYFGWGAEDDDFLMRISRQKLSIIRFSPEISRYYMLAHKSEAKNPERFSILQKAEQRYQEDGLNSLKYQVLSYRTQPLYTHIIVQI